MGEREKIILADDQLHLGYQKVGFEHLLNSLETAEHEIVGTATSVPDVEQIAQQLKEKGITPTLAILDGDMPRKGDGAKAATILRKIFPEIKIAALSASRQDFGDTWWSKKHSATDIVTFIAELV